MRGQFYSHNTCINTCWYAQKCYLESEPNQEENATFEPCKSLFLNKSDNPQRDCNDCRKDFCQILITLLLFLITFDQLNATLKIQNHFFMNTNKISIENKVIVISALSICKITIV